MSVPLGLRSYIILSVGNTGQKDDILYKIHVNEL